MAGPTIATVRNPTTTDKNAGRVDVKLTSLATAAAVPVVIASIVAIAGAVLPFFSGTLEGRLKQAVEEAKTESERRDDEAEWMKSALSIEDPAERAKAVRFLSKAGLVLDPDKRLSTISDSDVPRILRIPEPTKPPAPGAPALPTKEPR